MKYTIMIGNPIDGFGCYGVFETTEAALTWANHDAHLSNDWCLMPIQAVEIEDEWRTYEVTAAGFDASSSATDHLVFWVKAKRGAHVFEAIEGTGAGFHNLIDSESDIDFWLPRDSDRLRKALLGGDLK